MGKLRLQLLKRPPLLLALLALGGPLHAELPSGAQVTAGSVAISNVDVHQQRITQSTDKAIVNWQGFSVGAADSVQFIQPSSSSVVLNRVIGNDASNILGRLSANGQVFLVNPNGIYFGNGASLDVGSLVASTLNVRDDDFLAGRYVFSRETSSARRAEVINAGVLKARDNGYVVLAGDYAANRGVVEARLGTVMLGAASRMTLDIVGDSLVSTTLDERNLTALAGVANSGQLLVDGGRVVMTAATARDLASSAVNNSGTVQARGVAEHNGEVLLLADDGLITLESTSKIDVSGDNAGGRVLIGGNFHGEGPQSAAAAVSIAPGARINADATLSGNGGQVAVWSNGRTAYQGDISARGGAQGGNGGFVEVSGRDTLDFAGTVNTTAAHGKAGTLLLDPADITITSAADSDIAAATPFKDATDNGGVSNLSVATLEAALAGGNVTIATATASGSNVGKITVSNTVSWTSGTTLSLDATNQIILNAALNGTGGALNLKAGAGATQNGSGVLTASTLELLGSGSFNLNGAANSVGTLAANVNGAVSFRNAGALAVGAAGATTGVNTQGNTLALNVGGALSQTADIRTNGLEVVSSAGTVDLSRTSNSIGAIAANTQGDFTLGNGSSDIYTQVVGGTTGIDTHGKNFTLNNTGTLWLGNGSINGTINAGGGTVDISTYRALQYGSAPVNADKLVLRTTNYAGLSGSFNSVNTLALTATGAGGGSSAQSFDFLNNKSLTLGTVNGVSGITTANAHAKVQAQGNITLASGVNMGIGHLGLFAAANGGYYTVDLGNQTINAYGLGLQGNTVSNLATSDTGSVRLLAADLHNSSFSYTTSHELTIGNVWGLLGLTATGNIYLGTGQFGALGTPDADHTYLGAFDGTQPYSNYIDPATNKYRAGLMIDEGITANNGNGAIYFNSASGIFQWASDNSTSPATVRNNAAVKADSLIVQGTGNFDLPLGKNAINHLAANVNGSFSLVTSNPIAIDHRTFSLGSVSADVKGVTTRADTLISGSVAGGDAQYNQHNILLASSDNPGSGSANAMSINESVSADTKGSSTVSLSVGASDTHTNALVATDPGRSDVLVQGSTLILGASAAKGAFNLRTNFTSLSAAGGLSMQIDNSAQTGKLTILGIGTSQGGGGAPTPVGDFYLTAGGDLVVLGGKSAGNYLQFRSNNLLMFGTMTMKDGARVLLQPLDMSRPLGVHNANDATGFVAQTNYSRATLLKFSQTAAIYVGSTPAVMNNDSTVPSAVRNLVASGGIHIASDGDTGLKLGYRSLSAESSGNIVASFLGDVYNLRLVAPNVSVAGFNVTGDQIQIFTNSLSMPSTAANYKLVAGKNDGSDTVVNLRSYNNPSAIWVGATGNNGASSNVGFSAALLKQFPDYTRFVISGSPDSPMKFANNGDILLAYNGQFDLGNRTLTISSGTWAYGYFAGNTYEVFKDDITLLNALFGSYTADDWNNGGNKPKLTKVESSFWRSNGGGAAGTTWSGCADLTTCQKTNTSTLDPTFGPGTTNPGSGSTSGGSCTGSGCSTTTTPPPPKPPAPPGGTSTTNTTSNAANTGNNNSNTGSTTNNTGNNPGNTGTGGSNGSGDGCTGAGCVGTGTGTLDPNAGMSDGGPSGGGGSTGSGGGGSGDGFGGSGGGGGGSGGSGSGTDGFGGGSGSGSDGSGSGGAGSGNGGSGSGDGSGGFGGGSGSGSGDGGAGDSGSGLGMDGGGSGNGGSGAGSDSGAGSGSDGSGDSGSGGSGGSGSGSTGSGSGGAGFDDGSGGDGGAGSGNGGSGTGDGSGNGGNAGSTGGGGSSGGGFGDGDAGDGSGAGSGQGGSGGGDSDSGAGGNGSGNGGGTGSDDGSGASSGSSGSGSGGSADSDSGMGAGSGQGGNSGGDGDSGRGGAAGSAGSAGGDDSGEGGASDAGQGGGDDGSGSGNGGAGAGGGSGGAGDSGEGAGSSASGNGGNGGGSTSDDGSGASSGSSGSGSGGGDDSDSGMGAGSGKGSSSGGDGDSGRGGAAGSAGSAGGDDSGEGGASGAGQGGGSGGADDSGMSGSSSGAGSGSGDDSDSGAGAGTAKGGSGGGDSDGGGRGGNSGSAGSGGADADDSGLSGSSSGAGSGSSGDAEGGANAGTAKGGSGGADSDEGGLSGSARGAGSGGGEDSGDGTTAGSSRGGNTGSSDEGTTAGSSGSGSGGAASGEEGEGKAGGGSGRAGSKGANSSGTSDSGDATAVASDGTGDSSGGGSGGGVSASESTERVCIGSQGAHGEELPDQGGPLSSKPLLEVRNGGVNLQSECSKRTTQSVGAKGR